MGSSILRNQTPDLLVTRINEAQMGWKQRVTPDFLSMSMVTRIEVLWLHAPFLTCLAKQIIRFIGIFYMDVPEIPDEQFVGIID